MDRVEEGIIEALSYIPEKGEKAVTTKEVQVSMEYGIEGDYHGRQGDKKLLLFSKEAREQLEKETEKGLCFSKFSEHITISGLPLWKLQAGDILKSGEAEFKVLPMKKKCHPKDCNLENKANCLLKRDCVFVEIIQSGKIGCGQTIQIRSL